MFTAKTLIKRFLSIALAFCVLLSAMPISVIADDQPLADDPECPANPDVIGVVISEFDTLDSQILNQSFPLGEFDWDKLVLPETLSAADAEGNPLELTVSWVCDAFDSGETGSYELTAELPEGYECAGGVKAPVITVVILSAEPSREADIIITAVDGLEPDVLYQSFPLGELDWDKLVLPETLSAADAQGNPLELTVSWVCDAFDPGETGSYEFTAELPEGCECAGGVELPVITVVVSDGLPEATGEGAAEIMPLAQTGPDADNPYAISSFMNSSTISTTRYGGVATTTVPYTFTTLIESLPNDNEAILNYAVNMGHSYESGSGFSTVLASDPDTGVSTFEAGEDIYVYIGFRASPGGTSAGNNGTREALMNDNFTAEVAAGSEWIDSVSFAEAFLGTATGTRVWLKISTKADAPTGTAFGDILITSFGMNGFTNSNNPSMPNRKMHMPVSFTLTSDSEIPHIESIGNRLISRRYAPIAGDWSGWTEELTSARLMAGPSGTSGSPKQPDKSEQAGPVLAAGYKSYSAENEASLIVAEERDAPTVKLDEKVLIRLGITDTDSAIESAEDLDGMYSVTVTGDDRYLEFEGFVERDYITAGSKEYFLQFKPVDGIESLIDVSETVNLEFTVNAADYNIAGLTDIGRESIDSGIVEVTLINYEPSAFSVKFDRPVDTEFTLYSTFDAASGSEVTANPDSSYSLTAGLYRYAIRNVTATPNKYYHIDRLVLITQQEIDDAISTTGGVLTIDANPGQVARTSGYYEARPQSPSYGVQLLINEELRDAFFSIDTLTNFPAGGYQTPFFTEQNGEHSFTSQEEMVAWLQALDSAEQNMYLYEVGKSEVYDIPIYAVIFTTADLSGITDPEAAFKAAGEDAVESGKLRLMEGGYVHGSESSGGEGCLAMIAELAGAYGDSVLQNATVVVYPRINPAGARDFWRSTRAHGESTDPNRDKLALQCEENVHLNKVYNWFLPELYIDHHEYFSATLAGFLDGLIGPDGVEPDDVQISTAPYSTAGWDIANYSLDTLEYAFAQNRAVGLRSSPYGVAGSTMTGTTFYSLTGALNFVVEVRGVAIGADYMDRRVHAQVNSAKAIFDKAISDKANVIAMVAAQRADLIEEGGKYDDTDPFVAELGKTGNTKGNYDYTILSYDGTKQSASQRTVSWYDKANRTRMRPTAYIVEKAAVEGVGTGNANHTTLKEILDNHFIEYYVLPESTAVEVSQLYAKTKTAGSIAEADLRESAEKTFAQGDYFIPMDQLHNQVIAYLLEQDYSNNVNYDGGGSLYQRGYVALDASDNLPIYHYTVDNPRSFFDTPVEWSGLTANGADGSVTTTALTLTFDVDPTTLTVDDVTVTGAAKGELSGADNSRTLTISDITVSNGENVTVTISGQPAGFIISPTEKTVAVYKAAVPVTAAAIGGVTSPVAGAQPSTAISDGTGFTSALVWDDSPESFGYNTAYTATITLSAASGYTFSGGFGDTTAISGFTVNGVAPTVWVSNNGSTLVFKVTFPATDPIPKLAAPGSVAVSEAGLVTWDTVTNADSYTIKVYKGDAATALITLTGKTGTSYQLSNTDIADDITTAGTDYRVTVTAIGDGADYETGDESDKSTALMKVYSVALTTADMAAGDSVSFNGEAITSNATTTVYIIHGTEVAFSATAGEGREVAITGDVTQSGNITGITANKAFTATFSVAGATPLGKVTGVSLSAAGLATWTDLSDETGLVSYSAQLYKDGTASGTTKTSGAGTGSTGVSFLSEMRAAGVGEYTVTLTAIGDGTSYGSGPASDASAAQAVAKLAEPTGLAWSGKNAVFNKLADEASVSKYSITLTGSGTLSGGGKTEDIAKTGSNLSAEVTDPVNGDTFKVKAIAETAGLFLDSDESAASAAYAVYSTTITIPQINGRDPATAAISNPDAAAPGARVDLPSVTAKPGFTFGAWQVTSGGVSITGASSASGAYFTMGSANVELEAAFTANPLTFGDKTLSSGRYNETYSESVNAATGGSGTYTYAVTGGTLPAWLSMDADGVFSGTPDAAAAAQTFTVTATDTGSGATKNAAYTIAVDKANQTLSAANIVKTVGDGDVALSGHATSTASGQSGTITYAVTGAGTTGAKINGTTLSYTAPGTATITVTAAGSANYSIATETFTLTVNDLPSLGGTADISGTSAIGQQLTLNTAAITGNSGTPRYQWQADGASIGTNSDSYMLTGAQAGKKITCVITYSGSKGSVTATLDSGNTVPYNITITNIGDISGDTGVTLSAPTGRVNDTITLSYELGNGGGTATNTLTFTGASGLVNLDSAGQNVSQDYQVTAGDAVNGVIAIRATFQHTSSEARTLAFNTSGPLTKVYGSGRFSNAAAPSAGEGAISYLSSDATVATVDENGEVTILKAGATVITAVIDDNGTHAKAEASYTLTINNAAQSAPSGLDKTDETAEYANDGTITGVTAEMEYKKQGDPLYTPVTSGTTIAALEPGTYLVRYAAKENYDAGADATVIIASYSAPATTAPSILTSALSGGMVGSAYRRVLTASGAAPFTWTLVGGALPRGLTLSSAGVISGTPTISGTYQFTVRVSNGTLPDATRMLYITISAYVNDSGGGADSSSGSSGESDSSGEFTTFTQALPSTTWLEQNPVQLIVSNEQNMQSGFGRTQSSGGYGVRGDSFAAMKGLRFEHDTILNNIVQLRLYIDQPENITKDTMVSGYVTGSEVNGTRSTFETFFSNRVQVIHLDQREDWGVGVRIAARVTLSEMDTKALCFYSYDRASNTYRRIPAPAYWIDANGYLRFTTPYAGDIIISNGLLSAR